MRKSTRGVIAAAAGMAAAVALAGPSALASEANPLDYELTEIESFIQGPATNQSADVLGDVRPELVVSIYGAYSVVAGEAVLNPGSLHIYKQQGNAAVNQPMQGWDKITVFGPEENIVFPSQVTIADVDGDGDMDLIHGGGFFWDSNIGINRGTMTWWEQRANGAKWVRHSLLTGSPFAYHDLDYADVDGDGIKDIVTVGEQGISRQTWADDIVELQYFKGLGGGEFAPYETLANRGGSSPKVHDVDGDGDMDIISAQYFNVSPFVVPLPFPTPPSDGSFVWFENTSSGGDLSAADFTKHEISRGQGPSYGIYPVENLFGDGQLRYVGVNHTNNTPGTPGPPAAFQAAPDVFLLTPGADIRAPWAVQPLAATVDDGAAFQATPRPGQAAPGKARFADLDGDGDIDLALNGDGDFRGFIIEQTAPGVFHQSVLEQSQGWGQGGISIADYNRDGKPDIAMSSFEANKIGVWQRTS